MREKLIKRIQKDLEKSGYKLESLIVTDIDENESTKRDLVKSFLNKELLEKKNTNISIIG